MQNVSKSFSKLVSVIVLCFLGGCCTSTQTTQTTKAVQKEVTVDTVVHVRCIVYGDVWEIKTVIAFLIRRINVLCIKRLITV